MVGEKADGKISQNITRCRDQWVHFKKRGLESVMIIKKGVV
jgi:hypothetical protein